MNILPVLLCGGTGSRLWPLSTPNLPKPFLKTASGLSLFQHTILRHGDAFLPKPLVVGHKDNEHLIERQLEGCGYSASLLLEPVRRNSCAAIAMACLHVLKSGAGQTPLLLVLACDHWIEDSAAFVESVNAAAEHATSHLVTFGISPKGPETGFGYIVPDNPLSHEGREAADNYKPIRMFAEKPNLETAGKLISLGALWNSGNFLMDPVLFLTELKLARPDILEAVQAAFSTSEMDGQTRRFKSSGYELIPAESVDRAVFQATRNAVVVKVDYHWQDLGNWKNLTALHDLSGKNNCRAEKSGQASIPLSAGFGEDVEHRELRPWGGFHRLAKGDGYQVKRLVVAPGQVLSLQAHQHRSEHWVIVSGSATVTLGENQMTAGPDQAVHVPSGAVHRIANFGKDPLVLIEVQLGSYLGEDDIIRIDDIYDRVVSPKEK